MLDGRFQFHGRNGIGARGSLRAPGIARRRVDNSVSNQPEVICAIQRYERTWRAAARARQRIRIARLLAFPAECEDSAPVDIDEEITSHHYRPERIRVRNDNAPRADGIVIELSRYADELHGSLRYQILVDDFNPDHILGTGTRRLICSRRIRGSPCLRYIGAPAGKR